MPLGDRGVESSGLRVGRTRIASEHQGDGTEVERVDARVKVDVRPTWCPRVGERHTQSREVPQSGRITEDLDGPVDDLDRDTAAFGRGHDADRGVIRRHGQRDVVHGQDLAGEPPLPRMRGCERADLPPNSGPG